VSEPRTTDAVRRDIEAEREALAQAVEELRDRIGGAADVGSRLRLLAPTAFATGFVVFGGIGATMRYFARRGRER
jgi:hypothetical protein